MKLNLANPIVFFDLETTGMNIAKDRIVESGNAYPRRSVCYSWHLR